MENGGSMRFDGDDYPLDYVNIAIEAMVMEIVDVFHGRW